MERRDECLPKRVLLGEPVIAYVRLMLVSRFFWLSLVVHDVRRRYRSSTAGMAWAVVQPALLALVISTVVSRAFGIASPDYYLHVLSGLCLWGYMTHVITGGCQSIRSAEAYMRQHRIPVAVYPLRHTLVGAYHFAMAMVPVLVLSTFVGRLNTDALLVLPMAFVVLFVFGWAMATICGIVNIFLPDTQHFLLVIMQAAFYCTPIIWRAEMLRATSYGWIVDCNPLAAFAEIIRAPLLPGIALSIDQFWSVGLTTATVFFIASLLLFKYERKLVFHM